jgi:uncharacterized protein (DUF427 family)
MPRATWNGEVIAESASCERVEGNCYFPPGSVRRDLLRPSDTTTLCSWKGTAHYYTIVVNDAENPDAAWYYPDPMPAAGRIKDHVAFWRGVTVE